MRMVGVRGAIIGKVYISHFIFYFLANSFLRERLFWIMGYACALIVSSRLDSTWLILSCLVLLDDRRPKLLLQWMSLLFFLSPLTLSLSLSLSLSFYLFLHTHFTSADHDATQRSLGWL
jgi:hypothetical protein